ncbi:EPM2A-interacting protein 1-like [Styela clava]
MQGRNQLLAVDALQSKLELFQKQLSTGNMIQFESMSLFFEKRKADLVPDFEKYAVMCGDLRQNFLKRFQDLNDQKPQMDLFQRPFSVDVEYIEDADAQLELLDLRSNQVLQDVFQENSLLEFYSRLEEENYPVLLRNAKIWVCQFASKYSCEQAFSIMKINKSQLRTRLLDEHLDSVMRIAISPLKPTFQS